MLHRSYFVYSMTNRTRTVLYTGVTTDLKRRVWQHREKIFEGFTSRYQVERLVYYEMFDDVNSAIAREKQLKAGSRQKKIDLVNALNAEWRDLFDDL